MSRTLPRANLVREGILDSYRASVVLILASVFRLFASDDGQEKFQIIAASTSRRKQSLREEDSIGK
jgi:hypothetical protein